MFNVQDLLGQIVQTGMTGSAQSRVRHALGPDALGSAQSPFGALLGGGAWVLMSGGSAEDPLPDPSEATTPAPTEAPQAAGALTQDEEDLEASAISVERETAGSESPDQASVDPSDAFLVEVLDAETKQPLPHMQLHWLDITGRE